MNKHDASSKAIGYLYQIQCSLLLLLQTENTNAKVCIEKFDDVSIDENGTIVEQFQLKHHQGRSRLIDTSNDLWRTLKDWQDCVQEKNELLNGTSFCIITTAVVPDSSIARMIMDKACEIDIYDALKKIAETVGQDDADTKTNEKYYKSFLNFEKEKMLKLIKLIKIFPLSPNITNVEAKIKQLLGTSTLPKFEEALYERVLGWWNKWCIECLSSTKPLYKSRIELRMKIHDVSQDFRDDNLPMDIEEKQLKAFEQIAQSQNMQKQLKLINEGQRSIERAVLDFCKAELLRGNWVKDCVISDEELLNYERKLKDEWNYGFSNLLDESENDDDVEKRKKGRTFYKWLMERNIRIRSRVDEPYVMRGNYHRLSNDMEVGWHPDYKILLGE